MRRRVLMLGSTAVYLHLGTVLFMGYALLTGFLPMLLTALFSILLHECAHAAAAAMLGQPPGEMELTPMGAVMRLEDEERLPPLRRALMLLAGPAATLTLCALAYAMTSAGALPVSTGRRFFLCNAAILLVNLLPALPLDGGRLLLLALTPLLSGRTARCVMRVTGGMLGMGLIALGIWLSWRGGGVNLSLACAGCFILYSTASALTTQAMAELRMLMDRKIRLESRGHLPCRIVSVLATLPLRRCLPLLPPGRMAVFAVIEPGTQRMDGLMTEQQLISALLSDSAVTCRDALRLQQGSERTIFQGMTKREQPTH